MKSITVRVEMKAVPSSENFQGFPRKEGNMLPVVNAIIPPVVERWRGAGDQKGRK